MGSCNSIPEDEYEEQARSHQNAREHPRREQQSSRVYPPRQNPPREEHRNPLREQHRNPPREQRRKQRKRPNPTARKIVKWMSYT